MRRVRNPRQTRCVDEFKAFLHPKARERLLNSWRGVFRHVVLRLLSKAVRKVGRRFKPDVGAPTKELYSMVGLVMIMETLDWTVEEALDAYLFDASIQFALGVDPANAKLSERTLYRYIQAMEEDEAATLAHEQITGGLSQELELDLSRQRHDSTHVLSDMARMGRTRLMAVTAKRFLAQLKRRALTGWEALPEELRRRYGESDGHILQGAKAGDARWKQVAQDMLLLVERFAPDEAVASWPSYQALARVFQEQCDVVARAAEGAETVERDVTPRKNTGGDVVQNPSDPGATYDGHKGPGYQVQLSETCSEANEVPLVVGVIPQTAAEPDSDALLPMLDRLEAAGRKPEVQLADSAYGSDENVRAAAERGVELVSPALTNGKDLKTNLVVEFEADPSTGAVIRCPAGHAPRSSRRDPEAQTTYASMDRTPCDACDRRAQCPVKPRGNRCELQYTDKARRLAERRRIEQTEAFQQRYAKRAGIECANSGLKRKTGLGRLRVRGQPRVFMSIVLKCTGWNVLRAASTARLRALAAARARIGGLAAQNRPLGRLAGLWQALARLSTHLDRPGTILQRSPDQRFVLIAA